MRQCKWECLTDHLVTSESEGLFKSLDQFSIVMWSSPLFGQKIMMESQQIGASLFVFFRKLCAFKCVVKKGYMSTVTGLNENKMAKALSIGFCLVMYVPKHEPPMI